MSAVRNVNVITRNPIAFLRPESLSRSARREISELETCFAKICDRAGDNSELCERLFHELDYSRWLPDLQHPLSGIVNRLQTPSQSPHQGRLCELAVFYTNREIIRESVNGKSSGFIEALRMVCSSSRSDEAACYRSDAAHIRPGKDGVIVRFCQASEVKRRLEDLHENLVSTELPQVTKAVVALATVLNIHPFDDGNGRTARVLFNVVRSNQLNTKWAPLCFPLKRAFSACSGGFELRLRELETSANWIPLISYFHTLLKIELDAIDEITFGATHAGNRT